MARTNAAEAWYSEENASALGAVHQIDLLPPSELNRPLWRSLLGHVRDKVAPEKFPPLHLISRPIDLGMPLGERLRMPWFRTVFANIGEVVSPELLPPLELESRPVDVGELVSDQLSHPWFGSLLRNLADRLVPERQANLELESKPLNTILSDTWLLLPAWSDTISTPKVFYPDKPNVAPAPFVLPLPSSAGTAGPVAPPRDPAEALLRRDLRRSRIRGHIWMGVAAVQIVFLIASVIWSLQ